MRGLLLSLLFLALIGEIKAQDTIVKRSGEQIPAKVMEVNSSSIKFKRIDSPDGPLYDLQLWEIRYIIYTGGRKESYESVLPPPPPAPAPLIKSEDLSILTLGKKYYYKERRIDEATVLAIAKQRKDPKVDLMISKVREKNLIQNCSFVAGGILLNVGFYEYLSNLPKRGRRGSPASNTSNLNARQNGEYMMLGALACAAVAITFHIDEVRHARLVVALYNKTLIH